MSIRKPAVAGRFYPADKDELINLLHSIHLKEEKKFIKDFAPPVLIGGVVPHAGFSYSGYQAIHLFEVLKNHSEQFDTLFILHPNHNGVGPEIATDEHDLWSTPIGNIPLDLDFIEEMGLARSSLAHKFEHSGEVILPLVQYKIPYDIDIVPITMSRQNPDNARALARSIYEANKKLNKKIFVIASSDFSHYVLPEYGEKMDQLVLDEIITFDTDGIYNAVKKDNISVCGFGPIMTLVEYAKLQSQYPEVKILRRGNSGEVSPSREVVDYISILVYTQVV
jgi:AmmeMemoRadiSam system protein B